MTATKGVVRGRFSSASSHDKLLRLLLGCQGEIPPTLGFTIGTRHVAVEREERY